MGANPVSVDDQINSLSVSWFSSKDIMWLSLYLSVLLSLVYEI